MSPIYRTLILVGAIVYFSAFDSFGDDNWPQFRGPQATGIGNGSPPTAWNVESGEGIAWKTKIPGLGHASPIVWGNRVYVATAVSRETDEPTLQTGWLGGTGKSPEDDGEWTWQLVACDLNTGKVIWEKDVRSGAPLVDRHVKATHANCTPATDGRHIVAFYGSEGLYCFDTQGQQLWEHDFGKLHSGPYNVDTLEWGFASSPVIYDGKVIVQCDCLNANFVAILDVETGKELNRIERKGEVATWSTPAIAHDDAGPQIVCNGYRQMAGYSLKSGERLWHLNGGGDVPVPTPLVRDDLILLTNAHGGSKTFAVKCSARGDVTPSKGKEIPEGLAWWDSADGSYMPTPIIVDDLLYTCNDNGRLTVRELADGKRVYRQRVGTGSRVYSASAVAANGYLYFCSERGEVTVIKTGREFEVVANNDMQEIVMATPAMAGDSLLIRTVGHLVCVRPSDGKSAGDSVDPN